MSEENGRDKKHVKLSRKHLTMVIPKEDFEKHWKMVDERRRYKCENQFLNQLEN